MVARTRLLYLEVQQLPLCLIAAGQKRMAAVRRTTTSLGGMCYFRYAGRIGRIGDMG